MNALTFPAPRRPGRLTDIEVQGLSRWAQNSTLPAWREFAPTQTLQETIAALIAEWTAMRAVLDLAGEFAGDLTGLLARLNEGGGA